MASWFVDSSPVISTWLPSLLVVTSLLVLVMVLVLCTCWDNKTRNLQPACLGLNNLPTQQPQMIIQTNGSIPCKSDADPEDSAKLKVPTLQRKLPDIPVIPLFDLNAEGSDLQTNTEGSELYATVNPAHLQEAIDNSVETSVTDSPEKQILPKVPSLDNLAECSNEAVVSPAVTAVKDIPETVLSSGDSFNDHPYAHVHHKYTKVKEHPYDRLRGQNSEEQDTDTDNYEDPHVAASNWAAGDAVAYEPLPPVPEKRFDLSEVVPEEVPTPDSTPTAANAMSGRVSASDIPFVTSPIESPTTEAAVATGYSEPAYNSSQESGNGQEIRYTSISVREPLANLKVQIQSLSASAKQPNQQDSESYYAVVQEEEEEVDQTYAEIESGHTSATNSVTYAHIEQPAGNMPPRPPPVESLRCIAQVHSRQASTSSVGNALSPESDQQPSCLPFPSTSSAVLPDQHNDSCVMRKDRRTIHVTDSESLLTTNLEDMYAKVLKDKRFSLRHVDSIPRLPPPPPAEHISSDSVDSSLSPEASPPQGMHGSVDGGGVLLRRESSANDPGYEKIRDQLIANKKSACANFNLENEVDSTYQGENSSDPGYETVGYQLTNNLLIKDNFDPGYEWVRDDPGYETVGDKLSNFSNAIQDPGYETINDRLQSGCANDPGYESIRENQVEDLILGEDPAYESVRDELGIWFQDEISAANLDEGCIEHGYEVLHRPSQLNPNALQLYETVRYSNSNCERGNINYQQPDYESVIPPLLQDSSQDLLANVNLVSIISIRDSVSEFPPSTSQNQDFNEEASFSNVAVEQLDLCSDTFIEMEQNETINQNLIKNFEKKEDSVEEFTNEKETNMPHSKDIR